MPVDLYAPQTLSEKEARELTIINPSVALVDAFEKQLKELYLINNPHLASENKEIIFSSRQYLQFTKNYQKSFEFFYYPWNNTVVKCISENEYFQIITNRNRDLITEEEQKKLYNIRIAVFGMSVGSNISLVLTQAGISKNITVADFDNLETSNLNRIIGGIHQIGLNKCVIAARKISEHNPYAKIKTYQEGINEKLLESILKTKRLDCLIDEIDNIPLKINLRKIALKFKAPVLMITDNGEGVVLTVERYDLGYDKIFNYPQNYWDNKFSGPANKELAGKIIIENIVGGIDKVDKKMVLSVKKVLNNELVSWSQLGSSALLGGVAICNSIKEIVVGQNKILFIRDYFQLKI